MCTYSKPVWQPLFSSHKTHFPATLHIHRRHPAACSSWLQNKESLFHFYTIGRMIFFLIYLFIFAFDMHSKIERHSSTTFSPWIFHHDNTNENMVWLAMCQYTVDGWCLSLWQLCLVYLVIWKHAGAEFLHSVHCLILFEKVVIMESFLVLSETIKPPRIVFAMHPSLTEASSIYAQCLTNLGSGCKVTGMTDAGSQASFQRQWPAVTTGEQ